MCNFPLRKLPAVVLHEITRMLMPNEILILAMCSFRTESFFRYRRYKTLGLHIHLSNSIPQMDMNHLNDIALVRFNSTKCDSEEPVEKLAQIGGRYIKEDNICMYLTHASLNEMFDIYEHLLRLYSFPCMEWILIFDELDISQFYELLSKVLKTQLSKLTILGGSLSKEVMIFLMDIVPTTLELEIESEISLDFNDPKALNYFESFYKDARWVKLNDLYSIRNVYIVNLEITELDCSDLNNFLRYWAHCDDFMMTKIEIKLKEGTEYDEEVITDQLTVVAFNEKDYPQYFIKSNKESKQKFSLGYLELFREFAAFTTWDPHEDYQDAHELLTISSRRKELEEELRKIEEQIRDDKVLNVLEMRKKHLSMELEELNIKLRSKLIEFDKPFVV